MYKKYHWLGSFSFVQNVLEMCWAEFIQIHALTPPSQLLILVYVVFRVEGWAYIFYEHMSVYIVVSSVFFFMVCEAMLTQKSLFTDVDF